MSNSVAIEHEFVLPEFDPIDSEVREAMEAVLLSAPGCNELKMLEKTDLLSKLHPEFGMFTYEEQALDELTFRHFAKDWHIDTPLAGTEISLVSTSSPTIFAAGRMVVYEALIETVKESLKTESIAVADILWYLSDVAGTDWIESFILGTSAGDKKDKLEGLVEFKDLGIVQVLPFVLAKGHLGKTLHKSAPRSKTEPKERIIAVNHPIAA